MGHYLDPNDKRWHPDFRIPGKKPVGPVRIDLAEFDRADSLRSWFHLGNPQRQNTAFIDNAELILSGGTRIDGRGVAFDGVNDYATFSNEVALNQVVAADFTIHIRLATPLPSQSNTYVINADNNQFNIIYGYNTRTYETFWGVGDFRRSIASLEAGDTGYHVITCRRRSTRISLFFDGVLVLDELWSSQSLAGDWTLGAAKSSVGFWSGDVSDLVLVGAAQSDAFCREFGKNPYQILKPANDNYGYYIPSSGGEGADEILAAEESSQVLSLAESDISKSTLAVESSTVEPLLDVNPALLGVAQSTESAAALVANVGHILGTATELSTVFPDSAGSTELVVSASENSTVLTAVGGPGVLLGAAAESSTAYAVTAEEIALVGSVIENSVVYTALSVDIEVMVAAVESGTAYENVKQQPFVILAVDSNESAMPVISTNTDRLQSATESGTVSELQSAEQTLIGEAVETSTISALVYQEAAILSAAVELSTVFANNRRAEQIMMIFGTIGDFEKGQLFTSGPVLKFAYRDTNGFLRILENSAYVEGYGSQNDVELRSDGTGVYLTVNGNEEHSPFLIDESKLIVSGIGGDDSDFTAQALTFNDLQTAANSRLYPLMETAGAVADDTGVGDHDANVSGSYEWVTVWARPGLRPMSPSWKWDYSLMKAMKTSWP